MKRRYALLLLSSFALNSTLALAAEPTPTPAPTTTPQPMAVGLGTARFGGLFQAWALNSPNFNFRIRRAELKLAGSVADHTRWFIMIDPAKNLSTGAISATNDNKILQDLGVAFGLSQVLELVVGQFKVQTTAEGLDSSGELLFPERAYVARAYGDRRETGAMLTLRNAFHKTSLMVSNGMKANVNDLDSRKDVSLRTDLSLSDQWRVGSFVNRGDTAKWRVGLNARLTTETLLLRFEGVFAHDNNSTDTHAWTVDSAYSVSERIQPVARFEMSHTPASDQGYVGTIGLNYYLARQNSKIQGAYMVLHDMTGNAGSYQPSGNTDDHFFILNFQAAL